MEPQINLEQILRQLNSDKTRAEVILDLLEKGVKVPQKYLNQVIDYYEQTGKYELAVSAAYHSGLTKRAIDIYETRGLLYDAFLLAKQARLAKKAHQLHVKIVNRHEREENFGAALTEAINAGLTKRVNRLYVKAIDDYGRRGLFNVALNLAKKAGLTERVKFYETLTKSME